MRQFRALSLGGLVVLSFPAAARADAAAPVSDEQKAAARLLGTEGVKLAMDGDCSHAVDKLTRAEALVHAPTTAVWLGQCQIQLGHLVVGTEVLNRVIREALPDGAPKSWVDAKQRAQTLFDANEPRIGKLTIHVDHAAGVEPQVTVDGDPVPAVLLDAERPTDPGLRHVIATAPGLQAISADVSLADGQSQRVSLRLEGTPPGLGPATAGAAVPPPNSGVGSTPANASGPPPLSPTQASPQRAKAPDHTAAYVTFGVAGLGVIVGTAFGVLALGDKSRLDSDPGCPGSCPSSAQGDIDALHRDSLLSTVGFGVGVVGAALGTVLFVSAHGDEGPRTGTLEVRPWVGPGSAGVGGSF